MIFHFFGLTTISPHAVHSTSEGDLAGLDLLMQLDDSAQRAAGRLNFPRSSVAQLNPVLMSSKVVFESREGDATGWLHGNYNQGVQPKAKPLGPNGAELQKAQQVARNILAQKIAPQVIHTGRTGEQGAELVIFRVHATGEPERYLVD